MDKKATNKVPSNFNNARVNNEAKNLINQWQEKENQVEAKPIPLMKIIVVIAIAYGVYYFFKTA